MIQIELNGKTRLISIDDFLNRDLQDILADDIGFDDVDPLKDFQIDISSSPIGELPEEDI